MLRKMEFIVFDHYELEEFIEANYPDLEKDKYSVRGDLLIDSDHYRMTYYYDFPTERLPLLTDMDREDIKLFISSDVEYLPMTTLFIRDLIDKGILPPANYLIEVV